MDLITVKCWFCDSELFVAKLILVEDFKCQIRKIIDPYAIITGGNFNFERYEFRGKKEELDRLVCYLENSDYDVEVIRKVKVE